MDLARVRREIVHAQSYFVNTESHQANDGSPYILCALQTSVGRVYTLAIYFPENYPNAMPTIYVRRPELNPRVPHRYNAGNICYFHSQFWNPGLHTLLFVMERAAKWLNKYEVWQVTGKWPGAERLH